MSTPSTTDTALQDKDILIPDISGKPTLRVRRDLDASKLRQIVREHGVPEVRADARDILKEMMRTP